MLKVAREDGKIWEDLATRLTLQIETLEKSISGLKERARNDTALQEELAVLKKQLGTYETAIQDDGMDWEGLATQHARQIKTLEESILQQDALLKERTRNDTVRQEELTALKKQLSAYENVIQDGEGLATQHTRQIKILEASISRQDALLEERARNDAAHQEELTALKKKLSSYERASAEGAPKQGAGLVMHRRRRMSAYTMQVCPCVQY
jgi:peptidoglycan hydrolase CwlO-like protein